MEEGKKVNAEIEEMLTALGDPTPEDLKGDEGEEKEEDKPEEKKEEEAPEEKEVVKEEEKPEEKIEGEEEEVVEEEETDKDKIIESLRNRLNEKPEVVIPEKKEEKPDEKKEDPLKFEDQDFIGDLDLDDLTRDKTALNKILNSVYSKGVNDSKRIATEGVLNSIPDIVKHNLTLLTSLKEASDNFYKDNADLAPFKRVVAAVFEDIAAKNPDKKYDELMNLVAPEVRKRLELHKKAVKEEKKDEDGKPPRLHGAKSGQRQSPTKPNTSALESEISAMNKVIGR
jgi:hypothetical protein